MHALDQGYTYGLLWVAAVAVIVGGAALFIGYTAEQVAHAQEVKDAIDHGAARLGRDSRTELNFGVDSS